MKEGLSKRLSEQNQPSVTFIIETMRSILLDKQTASSVTHARTPMLLSQTTYAEIAALLENPLQMAKNLALNESALQNEEQLLKDAASKSRHTSQYAMGVILTDHQKDIESQRTKLKLLERRNGELSIEIDNPPQKKIEDLRKKMAACDKLIQSMGELISQLDNNEQAIKRVMNNINQKIIERAQLADQINAIKEAKATNPQEEQKQVREQMIAMRKHISEMSAMSNDEVLKLRKEKLPEKQQLLQSQKEALSEALSQVRKTRGINNETNDLLREGQERISKLHNPTANQHVNRAKM